MRITCEFHAKGWCIKGNSCRFLHVKDGSDAVVKKSEVLERQASSSACVLPQQSEAEKLSFGHNLDNYRYPVVPLVKGNLIERNTTHNGNFPSCSVTSHDNHHITRISPFGTTLEEMTSKKNDIVCSDPRSADLPYSHFRQPLSFGSSSWNTDALGTQNLLQGSLVRHASPSVPFRPSHAITRKLLLKENLYDPVRDCVEQTDAKNGRIKFSHSDQGSSVKNVNVPSNSSQEEEKLLDLVHDGDIVKDNILSSSCDNKLKFDKQRHKAVLKVDGSGKNEETDVDFKRDGHMQNESKALKYFQSALIEFVKELVKPTWHEGWLSKDAHKVIVKKTVDKVLSTVLPHQIPGTSEAIKLYLSSSQPKLAKLVELLKSRFKPGLGQAMFIVYRCGIAVERR
ncbi:hypothetical protein DH2020_017462 [Rehmannia glutinosa]|uniref:C3H1-type domain-containing protein n=1 Tax=Rehmannia glutinosa TaxID=99300 RepID=A0ABR0WUA5_REHGL